MSFASEFREFAVKGNVVDLAVGVIIGAAFGKIVDSLVRDIIMPIVGRIFGGLDFSNWFVLLGSPPSGYNGPMTYEALSKTGVPLLAYGNFITIVINFVILADGMVEGAIEAIVRAARTGKIGDGKIFVTAVEQVVRIRTGESGEAAVCASRPA